jgi:hypothetical protein
MATRADILTEDARHRGARRPDQHRHVCRACGRTWYCSQRDGCEHDTCDYHRAHKEG